MDEAPHIGRCCGGDHRCGARHVTGDEPRLVARVDDARDMDDGVSALDQSPKAARKVQRALDPDDAGLGGLRLSGQRADGIALRDCAFGEVASDKAGRPGDGDCGRHAALMPGPGAPGKRRGQPKLRRATFGSPSGSLTRAFACAADMGWEKKKPCTWPQPRSRTLSYSSSVSAPSAV